MRCAPHIMGNSHLAPKPKSPKLRALRARNFGLLGFSFVKVNRMSYKASDGES